MADHRTELQLRAERAVLVQVANSRNRTEADVTFAELDNLVRTAGAVIVGHLRQLRNLPDRRFYVGKGKHPPGWLREVLEGRERRLAAPTFAPDGLYLRRIRNEEKWGLPQMDDETMPGELL